MAARGNFQFRTLTANKYIERDLFEAMTFEKWRGGTGYRWNDVVWGYALDGQFQSYEQIASSPIQGGNFGNSQLMPGDFKYRDGMAMVLSMEKIYVALFYNGSNS